LVLLYMNGCWRPVEPLTSQRGKVCEVGQKKVLLIQCVCARQMLPPSQKWCNIRLVLNQTFISPVKFIENIINIYDSKQIYYKNQC